MATKKLTAFDFCRAYLKRNPKATFARIRDAAAKKRLKLYPISYGRAQALEGIVKTAKYGKSKKKKAGKKRGPGRPRGSKNKPNRVSGADPLSELVSLIRNLEKERDDALKVLDKIRELLS